MVMAEKEYPVGILGEFVEDVKDLFRKDRTEEESTKPGSEQPGPGKCGCHPGGLHPMDDVLDVHQRDEVKLNAIPVEVRTIVNVRTLPAKRSSMETFYPGTAVTFLQGKDPKLKRMMLCASGGNVLIGTENQIKNVGAATQQTQGFLLPSGTVVPWEGVDQDLWMIGSAAGSALSVKREYWPDV